MHRSPNEAKEQPETNPTQKGPASSTRSKKLLGAPGIATRSKKLLGALQFVPELEGSQPVTNFGGRPKQWGPTEAVGDLQKGHLEES